LGEGPSHSDPYSTVRRVFLAVQREWVLIEKVSS
jgi:hypothetical protein